MDKSYATDMGGDRRDFPATEWTHLGHLAQLDPEEHDKVVDRLLARYWKPVYCFIRQKGYDNESAKDLTQNFFYDIVIQRKLLAQADRTRGQFRSFLLAALTCYLTDQYRKSHAKKRLPNAGLRSMDDEQAHALPSELARSSPEIVYQYQWAVDLLDKAVKAVKKEYLDKGMETHWLVFSEKTLKPILENSKGPSYRQLCEKLENVNEAQAQSMEFTVKRRFGKIIQDLLRQCMAENSDVNTELNDLLNIFSRMGT